MTDRKPCLLCCKPLANQADFDAAPENEERDLCWSAFSECERVGQEHQIIAELRAEVERLKAFEPRLISFEGGEFKLRVAKEVMANLVCAFDELNGEANYTTLTMQPKKSGREYIVTVQRADRPTPHELRKKAEAEAAELRAENTGLRAIVENLPKTADGLDAGNLKLYSTRAAAAAAKGTP